ncbi:hypothetical protein ASPZODRAFT_17272 [Penicilliopsis zonata CBS 506.65]|uniref:Potassium channel tetramerisation-type BTB domain-containing protein n=1 Tax=Penicilliopsis zonata CBS 506.65 TaxID=1073090 RepID=A0A1L9SF60_9EURO|nr:hypothetical protein ASPZODRAFT_17272 [Penicilliopsis zonata CBS 506.65]OJJ45836.1 hypothetical protein ASPZODRAFT_17272 [Penicilliopsis zonata CBS 506.65]
MATGESSATPTVDAALLPKPAGRSDLPSEKVFSIQIGCEVFRLSGASIASDAPSYFSQFFEEQLRQNGEDSNPRTLYIDRDPGTFKEIAKHLQGYHIRPRDGNEFVKLFADAQFYSLPRLTSQLFESEIFIQIGDRHFEIPRDLFSNPGDSPNFFSLGFAVFFTSPSEAFPGLDRKVLLRPPAIVPPSVPNRSGAVFEELLHLLRGYPLNIRNEDHRAELLRDCRYFHLRGLEQRLIPHHLSYNPLRRRSEVIIRLEDVRQSGVQFSPDPQPVSSPTLAYGWVVYARPFVDERSADLIVEIGGEATIIDLTAMRADFIGLVKARVASLFQVVANKMNLPTTAPLGLLMMTGGASTQPASPAHSPLGEERVKIRLDSDTDLTINGEQVPVDSFLTDDDPDPTTTSNALSPLLRPTKRRRSEPNETKTPENPDTEQQPVWFARTAQWRLRVQPSGSPGGYEMMFIAVKLDVYTEERSRNRHRRFLTP